MIEISSARFLAFEKWRFNKRLLYWCSLTCDKEDSSRVTLGHTVNCDRFISLWQPKLVCLVMRDRVSDGFKRERNDLFNIDELRACARVSSLTKFVHAEEKHIIFTLARFNTCYVHSLCKWNSSLHIRLKRSKH